MLFSFLLKVLLKATNTFWFSLVREAAKKFFFLGARPLRGGGKGLATKKKEKIMKDFKGVFIPDPTELRHRIRT